jgi:hypothetical protein
MILKPLFNLKNRRQLRLRAWRLRIAILLIIAIATALPAPVLATPIRALEQAPRWNPYNIEILEGSESQRTFWQSAESARRTDAASAGGWAWSQSGSTGVAFGTSCESQLDRDQRR